MDSWITSIIGALGNFGIALLMFLENVFPPLPSELIMPLAGFTAARGELSLGAVIVAGSLGSLAGQFPLYYLGRGVGQQRVHHFADRYGKWVTLSGKDVDRAADWLVRRGAIAVFLCRLVPGVRSLISIPAGAGGMSLLKFTAYSTLGIALWSALLAAFGFVWGDNYDRIAEYLGPIGNGVWIALGAALLAWIGYRLRGCIVHARVDCPLRGESNGPLK